MVATAGACVRAAFTPQLAALDARTHACATLRRGARTASAEPAAATALAADASAPSRRAAVRARRTGGDGGGVVASAASCAQLPAKVGVCRPVSRHGAAGGGSLTAAPSPSETHSRAPAASDTRLRRPEPEEGRGSRPQPKGAAW